MNCAPSPRCFINTWESKRLATPAAFTRLPMKLPHQAGKDWNDGVMGYRSNGVVECGLLLLISDAHHSNTPAIHYSNQRSARHVLHAHRSLAR
jgi:hypothetical protein